MNTYPEVIQAVIADKLRFRFKEFQRQDYARMALHDGGVLGHDTGGGKTIALFALPALKCGFDRTPRVAAGEKPGLKPLAPVLIVAPGDLHGQIMQEGADHFRARVTPIDSQETFLKLSQVNPAGGGRILPPGYYITSYTQLSGNGVQDFPKFDAANWFGMMQRLGLTEKDAAEYHAARAELYKRQYKRLRAQPSFSALELRSAWTEARRQCTSDGQRAEIDSDYEVLKNFHPKQGMEFNDLDDQQQEYVLRAMTCHQYQQYADSLGETRWYDTKQPPKRIAGRAGEINEFVEFQTPEHRFIAQQNHEGWSVYKATGDAVEVVKFFDAKRTAAEAFAGVLAREAMPEGQAFKVKCVYSPSLADLCQDSFECVVVDEGVRMKGEESEIGLGVRQMTARYKYVLSATPIKNRLPDVFRLAWWATGGGWKAHARWPYPDTTAARDEFAAEFLISERNLSKQDRAAAGSRSRFLKLTPQVCNIHRAWKLFAPVILRRRKADFGEDIVPMIRSVVRAPMGREQAAVYKFHLDATYLDVNGRPAIGAQLQALRIAAANPCSTMLDRPFGDGKTKGEPRSRNSHTPKLHAAFNLITQILQRGEQVVIFSAFQDSLDGLANRLQEAGVKFLVADGRMSPKRRGETIKQFKLGGPRARREGLTQKQSTHPVLLAGVESVAEGHSLNLCNNVILLCYSWAMDKFIQAISRAHRLNSPWPVNIFPIICDGSIDRKLEANIQEKSESAALVLDGKLLAENVDEVNLAELLQIARDEFANNAVVEEAELAKEWPRVRKQLGDAMQAWSNPWAQVEAAMLTPVEPARFNPLALPPAAAPEPMVVKPVVTVSASSNPVAPQFTVQPAQPKKKPVVQVSSLDDLPLWTQTAKLPPRPRPFAKK